MVGSGAGDALDQVGGPIALALAVDLLAEPAEQAAEIAAGEGVVEAAELGTGRIEELGRVDVAQGIGREIADQPGAPVDVLEAALGVVARA